jgi:hypothetical protein
MNMLEFFFILGYLHDFGEDSFGVVPCTRIHGQEVMVAMEV